jgi:hypothetical protein
MASVRVISPWLGFFFGSSKDASNDGLNDGWNVEISGSHHGASVQNLQDGVSKGQNVANESPFKLQNYCASLFANAADMQTQLPRTIMWLCLKIGYTPQMSINININRFN